MKDDEIIQNNRLIAEFMGAVPEQWYPENKEAKQSGIHYSYPKDEYPENEKYVSDSLLKYHTDWNWLMGVLESIPKLNPDDGKLWFEFEISRCHCKIWSNKGLEIKNNAGNTLDAIYLSVIQFIHYYNKEHGK